MLFKQVNSCEKYPRCRFNLILLYPSTYQEHSKVELIYTQVQHIMADSVQDDDAIQVNPTDGVIQICHSPADAVSANILLLDVGLDDLKHEIASSLGVSYLDPAPEGSHQQVLSIVNGCVYGPNNREMLALPVAHISGDPLWVIFLYDSGAPVSQFSKQVWNVLFSVG